jgi:hypothetical protein
MHELKSPFGLPRLLISQYDMQTLIKEFFLFFFLLSKLIENIIQGFWSQEK